MNLTKTNLVLDQAIYSKDVEQHSDLRDFINLRIGGFHATFAFLSFIGKELCTTDLKDVIVVSLTY